MARWKTRAAPAGDVEPQIGERGAMGEPAAGKQVDAGGGYGARGFEIYPPGGLGNGAAVDHRDGMAHRLRGHIVEQHRVDPNPERLGELVERIDLVLDLD